MAWCQQGLEGCCKYPRGKLGNCCDLRHPKLRSRCRPNTWSELSFWDKLFLMVVIPQLFRTWDLWIFNNCCCVFFEESDPSIWWWDKLLCTCLIGESAQARAEATSRTNSAYLQNVCGPLATSRSSKMQGSMNKQYLLKSPSTRSA